MIFNLGQYFKAQVPSFNISYQISFKRKLLIKNRQKLKVVNKTLIKSNAEGVRRKRQASTLALHKFVKKSKLIWEIINSDTYDAKSLHGALPFFLCCENRQGVQNLSFTHTCIFNKIHKTALQLLINEVHYIKIS